MPTPSIQILRTDAQQVLNLDSISAVRSVVAATLANANAGTPLNPNLTTQQLWNEFYQIVTQPKSDIESIIANQLMKFLYAPPAPGGAGADKQVIFNDGGVLAGDSGLTFNKTTDLLTVGSLIVPGNVQLATVSTLYVGTLLNPKLKVDVGGTGVTTITEATITGDLTVDTSTLKVDSTNNRVLIGTLTALGSATLSIAGKTQSDTAVAGDVIGNFNNSSATGYGFRIGGGSATGGYALSVNNNAGNEFHQISGTGIATWSNVGGVAGTAMTLNSTGLGVGVTPSAWGAAYKAVQQQFGGSFFTSNAGSIGLSGNCYNNGTNWLYASGNPATRYEIGPDAGNHRWFIAPTGTAGNPISGANAFVQAMTLDASGNLLLATTTNTPSARQYINQASGSNPALYIAGGASTTPLINFNGAGRIRSDGQYLALETTNASGVIYVAANTNGVYLAVGRTSWTANSDERLKDIIEPISNAVAKVGSLRSVIGKFKNDETNTRRSFLIAQDVQAVLPEAVDASNPDRLGVAYSEVIPLLVAAIKELTARVQTLETR